MSKYFGITVLNVKNFGACLKFYRDAIGMEVLRAYRGPDHPDWALLQLGEVRMALHAGHEGAPLQGSGPICMNFFVKDAQATARRIPRFGGSVQRPPEEFDFRPTQPVVALFGKFADPDGNEHFLVQETRPF